MKYLLSTLITIIALVFLTSTPPVLAQTSDEDCAGTMGAGYGLCIAASMLGCGTDSEKDTNACTKIEDNFVTITGELPPWLAVACPCFTQRELSELQVDGTLICSNYVGSYASIGEYYDPSDTASARANVYWTNKATPDYASCTYGYSSGSPDWIFTGKQVRDLTLEEVDACHDLLVNEMQARSCLP